MNREEFLKRIAAAPPTPGFMAYASRPHECPNRPHRGPAGPNEDIAQCPLCLSPSWSKRPIGETWGNHIPDCSLPIDHENYCEPGGKGHPEAPIIRGC